MHVRKMEVAVEAVKRAMDALVPILMNSRHNLLQQRGGGWDVEAPSIGDHVIDHCPRRNACTRANLLMDGHQCWICGLCVMKTADEVETRRRDSQ
jgi:hypothetical protein